MPGATVFSPSYYDELRSSLSKALYDCQGLAAVRYPRGGEFFRPDGFQSSFQSFDFYGDKQAEIIIVTYGRLFSAACMAYEKLKDVGIKIRIVKLNRIKPLDTLAVKAAVKAKAVFFFEEGIKQGGTGEHFSFLLSQEGFLGKFFLRAITGFVSHATMQQALADLGLDADGMAEMILTECCK